MATLRLAVESEEGSTAVVPADSPAAEDTAVAAEDTAVAAEDRVIVSFASAALAEAVVSAVVADTAHTP